MNMQVLLEKLDEKLNQQTQIITATVTKNLMEALDEKLKSVIEENNNLKIKVATLEQKLNRVDIDKRRNNLVFFGIEEKGKREDELVDYITDIIIKSGTNFTRQEINNLYRIGAPSNKNRPLVVSFTTTWKKHQILRNKTKLPSDIYIKEDYPKQILEVRKQLQVKVEEERKKGNIAFLKHDKLVVKKPNEANREKRKREDTGSPNSPTQKKITATNFLNKQPISTVKDVIKPNILKYVTRERSMSVSDISKNY